MLNNLARAKKNKNDEFYTQLVDIEKELVHYNFTNKIIYCNCDTEDSNFVKYFRKQPVKKLLVSNGLDFRSQESIKLLKESDIVVTNPPFSLFREYVAQLIEYNKQFLILGNYNAVTYKEIFPLIKDNKLWLGVSLDGRNIWFRIPEEYEKYHKIEDGIKYAFVASTVWYTNLDHNKRHEKIIPYKHYTPEEYPKYDNYDAININKVKEIPMDYDGVMGVPITFMNKYNPEQFEIIWQACGNTRASAPKEILDLLKYKQHSDDRGGCGIINGSRVYARFLLRNKKVQGVPI